ncbi:MAG: hypothetical protein AAFW68_01525 [Pseudomonadota bacterium]
MRIAKYADTDKKVTPASWKMFENDTLALKNGMMPNDAAEAAKKNFANSKER